MDRYRFFECTTGVECGPNDVEEVVQVERADDRKEPLHHGPLQVFSSVRPRPSASELNLACNFSVSVC